MAGHLCSDAVCVPFTTVNVGEMCDAVASRFCKSDAYCSSEGVCEARVAAGGACTGVECVLGTYCDVMSSVCTATSEAAVGETCGFDSMTGAVVDCVANAYCNDGTCAARVADGAACTSSGSCEFGARCVEGTCQLAPDCN